MSLVNLHWTHVGSTSRRNKISEIIYEIYCMKSVIRILLLPGWMPGHLYAVGAEQRQVDDFVGYTAVPLLPISRKQQASCYASRLLC